MSDLGRFGVAMERQLRADYDRRIAARGYENRSEALRDLVRADLTRGAWESGAQVAATVTLVYDPAVRDVVMRITGGTRALGARVISGRYAPLDASRCLEVVAVRGRASEVSALAGRLSGVKGVLSCELTVAARLEGGR